MAQRSSFMGIGMLSRTTGCNIETIRYYEKIGLLPAPGRSAGGHRAYDDEHTKRLSFIVRSRRLGFTTKEIRRLLNLADTQSPHCAEVQAVTETHLAEVREKIAELRRLERRLAKMVKSCGATQEPGCPVIEELFTAA